MKYKLLICDIDGTLIPKTPMASISQKAKSAIIKATKFVLVGLATARPYEKNARLFESLHLTSPVIVSNGAQIVDTVTKKFLREYPLSSQAVVAVCQLLEQYQTTFWIQDSGIDYSWKNYYPQKPLVIVVSQISEEFAQTLLHELNKIPDIIISKSSPELFNAVDLLITHPLATKHHAILELCRMLKIKREEIIGVGDDYNDISFLTACGLKIAPENAIDEVKLLADDIVPSVMDDGIEEVVEKFIC